MNLQVLNLLHGVAEQTGYYEVIGGREEFDRALSQIEAELGLIAVEVHAAETRRVPLNQAAQDFMGYPNLARFHAFVGGVIKIRLPAPLEQWAMQLLAVPDLAAATALYGALVYHAGCGATPLIRALCRLLTFETVRLGLAIDAARHRAEVTGVGIEEPDLDEIAWTCVAKWLESGDPAPEGVRPLHVLAAAALEELAARSAELKTALQWVRAEIREHLDRRVAFEEVLDRFDHADALLIRNVCAKRFGEQRLAVDQLRWRHERVLGRRSVNALRLRVSQIREGRLGSETKRLTKRRSLLDLIRDFDRRSARGSR